MSRKIRKPVRTTAERTTIHEQHAAGALAATEGKRAGANPHDDFRLGVAWAAGFHGLPLEDPAGRTVSEPLENYTVLVEQTSMLGGLA